MSFLSCPGPGLDICGRSNHQKVDSFSTTGLSWALSSLVKFHCFPGARIVSWILCDCPPVIPCRGPGFATLLLEQLHLLLLPGALTYSQHSHLDRDITPKLTINILNLMDPNHLWSTHHKSQIGRQYVFPWFLIQNLWWEGPQSWLKIKHIGGKFDRGNTRISSKSNQVPLEAICLAEILNYANVSSKCCLLILLVFNCSQ